MSKHLRSQSVTVEAFLTPIDLLKQLRVNARTLYRLMSAGDLPAVRIGRQWRVRPHDFDLWLRRSACGAGAAQEPDLAEGTRGQNPGNIHDACHPVQLGVTIQGEPV